MKAHLKAIIIAAVFVLISGGTLIFGTLTTRDTDAQVQPAQQEEISVKEELPVLEGTLEAAPSETDTHIAAESDKQIDKSAEEQSPNAVSAAENSSKEGPAEAPQTLTCTLSITCGTILDNMDSLDPDKAELIPANGVILPATEAEFEAGESVFNVLLRETRKHGIHFEYVKTPAYNTMYVEGIANIYEFDCGELSGWMYSVNGEYPKFGCSLYELSDGDEVVFIYTCDLGRDIGGGNY